MAKHVTSETPQLSIETVSNIDLFCQIAKLNRAIPSLEEIVKLVPLETTEELLERGWKGSQLLGEKYRIVSGLVVESERCEDSASKKKFSDQFSRADRNIYFAKKFSALCGNRNLRLISVGGSTSYFSASEDDDLDFFCITKQNSLWIFLTRALILGRLFAIKERSSPPLCFSCTMDEIYAEKEFTMPKDALFARDAISAIVIGGESFYHRLLRRSGWMAKFLPKLYHLKIGQTIQSDDGVDSTHYAGLLRIINLFLYHTVGTYIRLKSQRISEQFSNKGRFDRTFNARMGEHYCIFESSHYKDLQREYANIKRTQD